MSHIKQYILKEFPNIEEECLRVLMDGILKLSETQFNKNIDDKIDHFIPVSYESWHLYYSCNENYFSDILKIWPSIKLFQLEKQIGLATSFDDFLSTYEQSDFGVFLANTKMLASIYPVLMLEWDSCYSSWISGSARILHQLAGLSLTTTQLGIRDLVNEAILHPEKYHNNPDLFKSIVKRQYQLSLTEQNC
jgi:hypothetical protein